MKGRVHSIESFGAVDGPGIRTVFFLQGCPARCIYCHNPDSWDPQGEGEGLLEVEDILHWAMRGKTYHGKDGGVTFSGGEPLMQGKFLLESIAALHRENIKVAIDTSGTYFDEFTEEVIKNCDLMLLDIKHTTEEGFKFITAKPMDELFKLIDVINEHKKPVWVRQVIVPDINDKPEDIAALNEFIKGIKYIERVELLGYHTMAVNKYAKMGLTYRLKGVPAMDSGKLNELRKLVKAHHKPVDAVSQVPLKEKDSIR